MKEKRVLRELEFLIQGFIQSFMSITCAQVNVLEYLSSIKMQEIRVSYMQFLIKNT